MEACVRLIPPSLRRHACPCMGAHASCTVEHLMWISCSRQPRLTFRGSFCWGQWWLSKGGWCSTSRRSCSPGPQPVNRLRASSEGPCVCLPWPHFITALPYLYSYAAAASLSVSAHRRARELLFPESGDAGFVFYCHILFGVSERVLPRWVRLER